MRIQKIVSLIILSLFSILKAKDLDRIAIFPFKTNGIDLDSSLYFVELLRKEVSKSNNYEIMEYTVMKKILSYNGYKGDILCYDDECAFVMGEFLSVKKIVQGFLKKKRNTFSINLRFLDLEKEEIILDITEHFKGSFEELLANKISKFAEAINWSTKYVNSVENTKKNKKKRSMQNNKQRRKSGLRVLFGITSLGTFGSGVIMNYLAEKKVKDYVSIKKEYKEIKTREQLNSANKRWNDAYYSADLKMKVRNVLYFLSGMGLTCFSITFFF